MKNYYFTSKRLGFRNWLDSDVNDMFTINQDNDVMRYFPSKSNKKQTVHFITRMQASFKEKGYCYFAVDRLDNNAFIGFVGLLDQIYKSDFTPCVDIGWRLAHNQWNQGLATEGAQKCLEYGLNEMAIPKIYSTAPIINSSSINVMKKIGMKKLYNFDHPLLFSHPKIKKCVLYSS